MKFSLKLVAVLVCLGGVRTLCADELKPTCWDFSTPPKKPLVEPLPLKPGKTETAHGEKENGVIWGAARGIVNKPIEEVYKRLLDHRTVKNINKTDLKTIEMKKPGYLAFHELQVKVTAFLFVKISWEEHWAYVLLEGTPEKPKKFLAFYQKAGGTSHLKHLCGSFVVTKLDNNKTDVSLYEQLKAPRRDSIDTAKMHLGTLRKLRADDYSLAIRK